MDMGMRDNRLKRVVGWILSVLLGRVTIPAWIAIAMAIFLGVPAWSEAVHFWLETAKTTPTWASPAATIIASPYFPPGLALFGFFYLLVVGYEGTDIVRHKIVPVTGWIVVGVCFTTVTLMAGYGWLELALRRAHDEGEAGIALHGAPSDNTPSHPQRPLQSRSRILQPDQIRILLQELPKLKQYSPSFFIANSPNDGETYAAATQFMPLLTRSGVVPNLISIAPSGPEVEGFIIAVLKEQQIPESAQKFQEILAIADIHANIVPGDWGYLRQGQQREPQFIFYAAPAPLN
jgi:hypothetical protein